MNQEELLQQFRKGDRLALSRILSLVEAETDAGVALLDELFKSTGSAHKIGITGPPGAGKSTLVNALVRCLRNSPQDPKIAVIAVDPTSPFTGGAILGDRLRMMDSQGDPKVFIRSMASRGALGGLSARTDAFSQVLDAAGFDYILIETVGAGQAEVEIVDLAHTTIVVDVPGLGDDIQSIKAGILEIADILVINKADRPGADQVARNLENMLQLGYQDHMPAAGKHRVSETNPNNPPPLSPNEMGWRPPVLKVIATENNGIAELVQKIHEHSQFLHRSRLWAQKDRSALRNTLRNMVMQALLQQFKQRVPQAVIESLLDEVASRQTSPSQAVKRLLAL